MIHHGWTYKKPLFFQPILENDHCPTHFFLFLPHHSVQATAQQDRSVPPSDALVRSEIWAAAARWKAQGHGPARPYGDLRLD